MMPPRSSVMKAYLHSPTAQRARLRGVSMFVKRKASGPLISTWRSAPPKFDSVTTVTPPTVVDAAPKLPTAPPPLRVSWNAAAMPAGVMIVTFELNVIVTAVTFDRWVSPLLIPTGI